MQTSKSILKFFERLLTICHRDVRRLREQRASDRGSAGFYILRRDGHPSRESGLNLLLLGVVV